MRTLKDILEWHLSSLAENIGKDPPFTYNGLPVDLSGLDEKITGYALPKYVKTGGK